MQENYRNYIGASSKDNWVKIYDQAYLSNRLGSLPSDWFSWDAKLENFSNVQNLCVHIISDNPNIATLPKAVAEVREKIKFLAMPIRFIGMLGTLPENLETLQLTGEGSVDLPVSARFPNVKRILIESSKFYFTCETFPNLKHLEFRLDKRLKMLKNLAAFEKLTALSIQPSPLEALKVIRDLSLSYLRLNESKLETIEEITNIHTLKDLWLHKWSSLTDISSLINLASLEDLTVSYCKKIQKPEKLLELKNLRRFFAFKCDNKSVNEIAVALSERGVDASAS